MWWPHQSNTNVIFNKELVLVESVVVERIPCVVNRCLKSQFPDDYYKRCLYASYGIHSLLQAMGYSPVVVGGNFLALVVSRDERQASMQGYGSDFAEHSHYWVELNGSIIDLGTHYLPVGSSFVASQMPALFWDITNVLPKGLIYASEARYASTEISHFEPLIEERMIMFIAACHARMKQPLVKPKLGRWLATTPSSFQNAASKGDVWARSVIRYQSMPVERHSI